MPLFPSVRGAAVRSVKYGAAGLLIASVGAQSQTNPEPAAEPAVETASSDQPEVVVVEQGNEEAAKTIVKVIRNGDGDASKHEVKIRKIYIDDEDVMVSDPMAPASLSHRAIIKRKDGKEIDFEALQELVEPHGYVVDVDPLSIGHKRLSIPSLDCKELEVEKDSNGVSKVTCDGKELAPGAYSPMLLLDGVHSDSAHSDFADLGAGERASEKVLEALKSARGEIAEDRAMSEGIRAQVLTAIDEEISALGQR